MVWGLEFGFLGVGLEMEGLGGFGKIGVDLSELERVSEGLRRDQGIGLRVHGGGLGSGFSGFGFV